MNDRECKGYAVHENGHCQIATTSTGVIDCEGPLNIDNVEALNENSVCGLGFWLEGCFIKKTGKTYK